MCKLLLILNDMKNFRRIILLLFVVALIPIFAFAHSGKTDSKGGHTDHSTGEYHYHHGYSAHQHPNGECPYNFNDKTYHSSSSTSYNKTSLLDEFEASRTYEDGYKDGYAKGKKDGYDDGYVEGEDNGYEIGREEWEDKMPSWVWWVLVALFVVILILFGIIRSQTEEIEQIHYTVERLNHELKFIREKYKEK